MILFLRVSSIPAVLVHSCPRGTRPSADSIWAVFPEPSTENSINSCSARARALEAKAVLEKGINGSHTPRAAPNGYQWISYCTESAGKSPPWEQSAVHATLPHINSSVNKIKICVYLRLWETKAGKPKRAEPKLPGSGTQHSAHPSALPRNHPAAHTLVLCSSAPSWSQRWLPGSLLYTRGDAHRYFNSTNPR